MRLLLATCLATMPIAVIAQDWKLRDSDVALSAEELGAALIGRPIVFYDNGESRFTSEGAYSYTYDQGGTAFGRFEIGDDSTVCIAFDNGFARCDMYVRSGERLVLLTVDGLRFPIRP